MDKSRKNEIISNMKSIVNNFEPTEEEPELTMFTLISRYNSNYDNTELVGGKWVRENIPDLTHLK